MRESEHRIDQMLPDCWEMRIDNNLGWPFFVDHNTRNNSWTDPRFMMARHQCPCAIYGYYEPERLVEIPIRYQGRSEPMPTNGLHHLGSTVNAGYNPWTNHYPRTNFQKHRQSSETTPQSRSLPRKCGNLQEIPTQKNLRLASHKNPRNHSPEGYQQNQTTCVPVSVGSGHEVSGPEACTSPMSTSKSPDPASSIQDSPCSSPRPDSSSESPQFSNQPQAENHHSDASTPDVNNPEFGQPSQQIPASSQQDETPRQPPHSEKSLEERAYEMINAIMSEVKGFEEQVNSFKGVINDKEYRYLEEMLTRCLLKLDNVESGSNETVRQARKQVVRYIEAAINRLELKALSSGTSPGPGSSVDFPNSQPDSNSECLASSHEQSNGGLQEHLVESSDVAVKVEEMNVDQETPVNVDVLKRDEMNVESDNAL